MSRTRYLALASAFALITPIAAAEAQWPGQRTQPSQSPQGYREGFTRGERAAREDSQRGEPYRFADEDDYQRGDVGYRATYGSREGYRSEFRYGFEIGYRQGYSGGRGLPGGQGRIGAPPWANGRASARFDLARETGFNDGYEAGLADARARRRADPIAERNYRNGDRGYERWYGLPEAYQNNYRDAFKLGYDRGYRDVIQYR